MFYRNTLDSHCKVRMLAREIEIHVGYQWKDLLVMSLTVCLCPLKTMANAPCPSRSFRSKQYSPTTSIAITMFTWYVYCSLRALVTSFAVPDVKDSNLLLPVDNYLFDTTKWYLKYSVRLYLTVFQAYQMPMMSFRYQHTSKIYIWYHAVQHQNNKIVIIDYNYSLT